MGTVVLITLLLITRFHVSKMDADIEERRRERISRREKRWSMNSQRLEQIVAELMRPIGDLRRSFDTDLSSLLEEYLTEAGLHALEADGASPGSSGSGSGAAGAPNFPELALLLQQSANIYGRKVDFLYQHVLEVSESLQNSTNELSQSTAEDASPAAGAGRRKRRASAALVAAGGRAARGGGGGARPPPTLPRMYVELEPRVLGAGDAPLADYAGEPVGLLQDFHVTWRLHGGLLVDDLEQASCGAAGAGAAAGGAAGLRAIPLSELQAAIEAAAPPEPPPAPDPDPDPDPFDDARLVASTPLPAEEPEPPPPAEEPAAPGGEVTAPALRRKRKPDNQLFERGAGKIFITAELAVFLSVQREFSVRDQWVTRVLGTRRAALLDARRRLRAEPPLKEFRGFDEVDKFDLLDMGGFLGWSAAGAGAGAAGTERLSLLARLASGDSDDDGFFEASDHGSDAERHDSKLTPSPPLPTPPPPPPPPPPLTAEDASPPEWVAWRSRVVARAAAGEARGLDVRALGRAVLAALPDPGPPGPPTPRPTPFADVLQQAATDDADVSRLFLATLFLANAGNVEVVSGPPLSLAGFSLRVTSRDERLYCAAADTDPAFLTR
ncbi:uncharacterized protein [Choristoneura fumiferana]|uniref:uncharacterized protein n=1 Tax=Choristoneura fumiferana TaxID=7141 RepID=UPI003D15885D